MKYKNPYYKKIKRSYILVVSCSKCKEEVLRYQKVGKGGLLKIYIDRIVDSELEISEDRKIISYISCKNRIGVKVKLKKDGKQAYKMIQGSFNTKEI